MRPSPSIDTGVNGDDGISPCLAQGVVIAASGKAEDEVKAAAAGRHPARGILDNHRGN
jgi:hypothetical protein